MLLCWLGQGSWRTRRVMDSKANKLGKGVTQDAREHAQEPMHVRVGAGYKMPTGGEAQQATAFTIRTKCRV